MDITDLDGEELVALSKAVDKLKRITTNVREDVDPGMYPVNLTVQVEGMLQIEPPTMTTPTPRLSQNRILGSLAAILMEQHCWGVDDAFAFVENVITQSLVSLEGDDQLTEDIEAAITRVQSRMKTHLPKKVKAGKVTFVGTVNKHKPPMRRLNVPRSRD